MEEAQEAAAVAVLAEAEAEGHQQQQTPTSEPEDGEIVAAAEPDYSYDSPWPHFRFDRPPRRVYHFYNQFRAGASDGSTGIGGGGGNNFLKGAKWSPDGSCFLTSSDDDTIRLFHLPGDAAGGDAHPDAQVDVEDSFGSSLLVSEAESIYDYCWYPYMSISDPTTCVFASTTKDHPIHLWDAISGQLRGTYRAYDAMDEITAALSVAFNTSGSKYALFPLSPSHQHTMVYLLSVLIVRLLQYLAKTIWNFYLFYTVNKVGLHRSCSLKMETIYILGVERTLIFYAGIFETLPVFCTSYTDHQSPRISEYHLTLSLVVGTLVQVVRMV